jgi:hypothetical protein
MHGATGMVTITAANYCGLADIRQAVGPGWRGLRTDRQYADQPD